MTQEQKAFIERVGALAAADMQKSGVLASLTIAQAILESGWGKSGLTVKANALFGIKAGDKLERPGLQHENARVLRRRELYHRDGPFPGIRQLGRERGGPFGVADGRGPVQSRCRGAGL